MLKKALKATLAVAFGYCIAITQVLAARSRKRTSSRVPARLVKPVYGVAQAPRAVKPVYSIEEYDVVKSA